MEKWYNKEGAGRGNEKRKELRRAVTHTTGRSIYDYILRAGPFYSTSFLQHDSGHRQ